MLSLRPKTKKPPVRPPDPERIKVDGEVVARTWLPPGKECAVIFTVDDVHPGKSSDAYEAGGDLARGNLRHIARLLADHAELRVTLFVTPDWRQVSPFPTRRLLARIPVISEHLRLAPVLPRGTMQLDRHPDFVRWLKALPRTDFAPHGLHHCHVGPRIGTEFQEQTPAQCVAMLREGGRIFAAADLPRAAGHQPPLWHVTRSFLKACADVELRWLVAGRDLFTAPSDTAMAAMNGPVGVSMMHPTLIWSSGKPIVHFTTNFQATSDTERAFSILDRGGVLAIKAHAIKRVGEYVALDGLDDVYRSYLDALLRLIRARYGDRVWFTNAEEIAGLVVSPRLQC